MLALRRSPLFHLSLSSKELFYSNFLAWIWDVYPGLFKGLIMRLCPGFVWGSHYAVKREYGHLDLCIIDESIKKGNRVRLIIENKFKSIPEISQLRRYTDEYPSAQRILLSLSTIFPNAEAIVALGWKIINYADLSAALSEEMKKYNIDVYHKSLIEDFCEVIGIFHQLNDSFKVEGDSLYYPNEKEVSEYAELRIDDWHTKYRYSQMLGLFVEK